MHAELVGVLGRQPWYVVQLNLWTELVYLLMPRRSIIKISGFYPDYFRRCSPKAPNWNVTQHRMTIITSYTLPMIHRL